MAANNWLGGSIVYSLWLCPCPHCLLNLDRQQSCLQAASSCSADPKFEVLNLGYYQQHAAINTHSNMSTF